MVFGYLARSPVNVLLEPGLADQFTVQKGNEMLERVIDRHEYCVLDQGCADTLTCIAPGIKKLIEFPVDLGTIKFEAGFGRKDVWIGFCSFKKVLALFYGHAGERVRQRRNSPIRIEAFSNPFGFRGEFHKSNVKCRKPVR